MNGKLRIALSLAGILTTASVVFYVGYTWAVINSHMGDGERHQTARQKEELIDERVDLHLKPLRVELRLMNAKLDRLLDQQGRTP